MNFEYVKDTSVGIQNGKISSVMVEMEYLPTVSKNRYKTRTGYIKGDVRRWMECLSWIVRMQSMGALESPIEVRISCQVDGTGRLPDTQNLVDVISDAVESGLSINDQQYKLITEPSIRADESKIVINIISGGRNAKNKD